MAVITERLGTVAPIIQMTAMVKTAMIGRGTIVDIITAIAMTITIATMMTAHITTTTIMTTEAGAGIDPTKGQVSGVRPGPAGDLRRQAHQAHF
jgi:mannitol-1-phosphate/altronate dehydrogenase